MKHELWKDEGEGSLTFCLAGPRGDDARKTLGPDAKLIWTVEAESHFESMTKYWEFMGWGEYSTDWESDMQPYHEEWANEKH